MPARPTVLGEAQRLRDRAALDSVIPNVGGLHSDAPEGRTDVRQTEIPSGTSGVSDTGRVTTANTEGVASSGPRTPAGVPEPIA